MDARAHFLRIVRLHSPAAMREAVAQIAEPVRSEVIQMLHDQRVREANRKRALAALGQPVSKAYKSRGPVPDCPQPEYPMRDRG